MKYLETILSLLIVVFWISMNTLLISREAELDKIGQFKGGIQGYLGSRNRRESWMSIRDKSRRIGYTGYTVEKLYVDGGIEYQISIETVYRGKLPVPAILASFLPNNRQLELNGLLVLTNDMKPLSLRMDLSLVTFNERTESARASFLLIGRQDGDHFLIELFHTDEDTALLGIKLPRDKLTLSNGLAPTIPVADFSEGKTYRVPVFDPVASLGFGSESATIEVLRKESKKIDGLFVDTWVVETRYDSKTFTSWVTSGGEILRQELGPPLNLVLTKVSSRKRALDRLGKRKPGTGN